MRFRCPYCVHDAELAAQLAGQRRPARALKLEFEVQGNQLPICPRCGKLSVLELVHVHFVVLGTGPLYHAEVGHSHIACMPKRDFMATSETDNFAATGQASEVSCPECMKHPTWKEQARAHAMIDAAFARKLALLGIET